MLCLDAMVSTVQTISADTSAAEAARTMASHHLGLLPVVDSEQHLLGVITDRDLAVRVLAKGLPATTPVSLFMTVDMVACHPQDELARAEELMSNHHKSRVLCVDDEWTLVGIISLSKLAQLRSERAADVLRAVADSEVAFTD